jgi:Na+/H+-dicarboxylate symporter
MDTAQKKLGVSPEISSVVLPLGATINMDGTALFEGIAAVFLAQMFGIPLDPITITTIFLVAMMASIGAPGVPSGSMAGMQLVLLSIGIPLEAIALLLMIERPLDTFRTAVNVEGDLVGSLFVSKQAQDK